jgi:hypothetical protein
MRLYLRGVVLAALREAELSEQDGSALRSGFSNIIDARLFGLSMEEARREVRRQ